MFAQFNLFNKICINILGSKNKTHRRMAVTYLLRGTKDVKKVYVHVSKGRNGLKVVRPTNLSIDIAYWDNTTKRAVMPKGSNKMKSIDKKLLQNKIDKFNAELSTFDENLNRYFEALEDSGELSEEKISNYITGKQNNTITDKFYDFVEYYINQRVGLSEGTIRAYKRTRNRVHEVFPKLRMIDIDDEFKSKFAKHFDKNKYQRSYLRKTLKNIIDFWNFAKKKKLKVSDDPEFWEITKEFPNLTEDNFTEIYLTLEELEIIKKVELPEYLDNTRDWLLISCWTSLRISDFMDLKVDKISEVNGARYITLLPQKTKATQRELTIPLFKEVEAILNKRNGQFPRAISHSKYNKYLKKVGEKANLNELTFGSKKRQKVIVNGKTAYRNVTGYFEKWELLTSHVGRRSFISNFLRQVDYNAISKITGHSKFAIIDLYDKTSAYQKAEDLRNEYKNAGIE